jgi:DNA-binding GntR family transcriptional regulator
MSAPRRSEAKTRSDAVYDELKQAIITAAFEPGSALTEAELAGHFGVSKTPIREALLRLFAEGLVEVVARSGYRVAPVTVRGAIELFGLRALLEGEALAQAASNAADLDDLHALLQASNGTPTARDHDAVSAFVLRDVEFHRRLAALSGNAELVRVLHATLERISRIYHLALAALPDASALVHRHDDLIGALLAGDRDLIRDIAAAQARAAQRVVVDALLGSHAVRSFNLTTRLHAVEDRTPA